MTLTGIFASRDFKEKHLRNRRRTASVNAALYSYYMPPRSTSLSSVTVDGWETSAYANGLKCDAMRLLACRAAAYEDARVLEHLQMGAWYANLRLQQSSQAHARKTV